MAETRQLTGGELLSAISSEIVGIMREHYGRGPMMAKTYAMDDVVLCVLRGAGLTPMERTMMAEGEPDSVVALRHDFQRLIASRYKAVIERLTERKVLAFMSQAHMDPDLTVELFFIDQPLLGYGALELHSESDGSVLEASGEGRRPRGEPPPSA